MCNRLGSADEKPAATLARFMQRELRLSSSVDPELLEQTLVRHWGSIAALAHSIHENELRRARNLTRAETDALQAQGIGYAFPV